MKVLKFGGTSVANPENINKVKSILANQNNEQIAVQRKSMQQQIS